MNHILLAVALAFVVLAVWGSSTTEQHYET